MQVDAFLLVLRQRGEIAGALTGVVRVARSRLGHPDCPRSTSIGRSMPMPPAAALLPTPGPAGHRCGGSRADAWWS